MKAIRFKGTDKWAYFNPFIGEWQRTKRTFTVLPYNGPQTVEEFCKLTEEHSPDELELVEIVPVGAKPVTEDVIELLNPYGPADDTAETIETFRWHEGFRAALDYLGVPVTEEDQP